MGEKRFVEGDRVRVSADFFWARGANGIISKPPGEVTTISGTWDGELTRQEISALGTNTVYWVWFDEPHWSAQASGQLGVRRERNAPEIGRAAVLLDKLDGVGGNSPGCFQLSDDPRRNLATALVSELHDGANRQVTSQLHGRSVLVEIGGARGHGK